MKIKIITFILVLSAISASVNTPKGIRPHARQKSYSSQIVYKIAIDKTKKI